jgi:hypothetical protein
MRKAFKRLGRFWKTLEVDLRACNWEPFQFSHRRWGRPY